MIFDLVETKFEKIKGVYLLDIDKDDVDIIPKIIITCPCDKNINGTYLPWKYTDYGYCWQKTIPNSSISFIFIWDKKSQNEPMFIYKYEPSLLPNQFSLVAKAHTFLRSGLPITKWFIQDKQTLQWYFVQNMFQNEQTIP